MGYHGFNDDRAAVAKTLSKLKSDPAVTIRMERGWTIATSTESKAMWSFTPLDHPAHLAFIKREVLERAGTIYLDTSARCSAEKAVCNQLVSDFIGLNETIGTQISED